MVRVRAVSTVRRARGRRGGANATDMVTAGTSDKRGVTGRSKRSIGRADQGAVKTVSKQLSSTRTRAIVGRRATVGRISGRGRGAIHRATKPAASNGSEFPVKLTSDDAVPSTAAVESTESEANADCPMETESDPVVDNAETEKNSVVIKLDESCNEESDTMKDLMRVPATERYPMTDAWLKLAMQSMSKKALIGMRGSDKLIGAHVSTKGGLDKVPKAAAAVGCRAFALFLRSNFSWKLTELNEATVQRFRHACFEYGFGIDQILPHGSYLLNAGSVKEDVFNKTKETLLYELRLCERLNLRLYVLHPGSTLGLISRTECCKRIAGVLNEVISKTNVVTVLLEVMAGQGNTVGGKFEEIKMIIDHVEDKSRVGVCLDTCHLFASGYNIISPNDFNRVMDEFDSVIGFKYLKGVHLNDSKAKCGQHLDRHEIIGKGNLGLQAFKNVLADPRFDGIPMVLETPAESYDHEIKLLYEQLAV